MAEIDDLYQAPKAAIVAPAAKLRRPRVYTLIAVFCWIVGAPYFLAGALIFAILGVLVARSGFGATFRTEYHLKVALIGLLGLALAGLYVAAGRSLWARRGRPGMILCGVAIALSLLFAWLLTADLGTPTRPFGPGPGPSLDRRS